MKKLATVALWAFLGGLSGWGLLGMFVSGIVAAQRFAATGTFPPEMVGLFWLGAVIGGLLGLIKVGIRIYVKD